MYFCPEKIIFTFIFKNLFLKLESQDKFYERNFVQMMFLMAIFIHIILKVNTISGARID